MRLPAAVVLAVVVAAHLALAPRVAGVDAFYHLGHAAQYAAHGPFDTSFPWATQSVIGDLGADLWWGFHMVLVPFALPGDPATGIRVAAVALTLVLAGSVGWLLRRHRVPHAGWWTALFLVAVPNVLFRYLMVRPHVLSLALALALLSFLVRGRWWQVAAAAAAITWLHLGLFWMAPGIVAAYALSRVLVPRGASDPGVPVLTAVAAVIGGTLAGAALRPHPVAAAELAYVQIVRLFAEKATERPLVFAVELQPLPVMELLWSSWSFLLAWAAAVAWAAWAQVRRGADAAGDPAVPPPERALLAAAVIVSVAFLALALASARRALVELVAFGFLTLPLVWTFLATPSARRRAAPALAVLLGVHLVWGAQRHLLNVRHVASEPDVLAEAAEWLAVNAPGDTVFHAHWDEFGPLFARGRDSRYLGGMDPIFQFAHDPGRYWEHFYLSGDHTQEYTCDAFPCAAGTATDTWVAIRNHFGARWVLVAPARNPRLTIFLLDDPRFALALETLHEAVFRVLDPGEAPPAPPS